MKSHDQLLYANEWLSLYKLVDPDNGINGYVYSHETRCNGKIVALLPYRKVQGDISDPLGHYEFLLRKEVTPCWHKTASMVSAITGGCDDGDRVWVTAQHELLEEAGYEAAIDEFIVLGSCRGTKSTDTMFYLFGIDVTEKEQGVACGDGSELEAKAHCFWVETIDEAVDPLVYVLHHRLLAKLRNRAHQKT